MVRAGTALSAITHRTWMPKVQHTGPDRCDSMGQHACPSAIPLARRWVLASASVETGLSEDVNRPTTFLANAAGIYLKFMRQDAGIHTNGDVKSPSRIRSTLAVSLPPDLQHVSSTNLFSAFLL